MIYPNERKDVAVFMKRLYDRKLTTASGGNISLLVGDKILITPSQVDKGRVKSSEICILSRDGENLTSHLTLSMESQMHLEVYRKREDIKAIVHAHPLFATSFTVSEKSINTNLIGEARAVLGEPVKASYALMGSRSLAEIVAEACQNANVILMENHGILTLGNTLLQAYDRMEVLEVSAKMTLITDILGKKKELSIAELDEIDKLFA